MSGKKSGKKGVSPNKSIHWEGAIRGDFAEKLGKVVGGIPNSRYHRPSESETSAGKLETSIPVWYKDCAEETTPSVKRHQPTRSVNMTNETSNNGAANTNAANVQTTTPATPAADSQGFWQKHKTKFYVVGAALAGAGAYALLEDKVSFGSKPQAPALPPMGGTQM